MRLTAAACLLSVCTVLIAGSVTTGHAAEVGQNLTRELRQSAYVAAPGVRRPATALSQPRLAPLDDKASAAQVNAITRYGAGHDQAARTLAHSPQRPGEFFPFFDYVETASTLPARDRELLILRAAWLTQSNYLWSRHVPRATQAGLDARQIRAVAAGAGSSWSPFERTLLGMADEQFRNSSVTNGTWSALTARYGQHQAMDAVVTVANMIEAGVLFNTLGVQPEEGSSAVRLPTDVSYRVSVPRREPDLSKARVEPLPGSGISITRTLRQHPQLAASWYAMANRPVDQNGTTGEIGPTGPGPGAGAGPNGPGGPRGQAAGQTGETVKNHDREVVILRIGWNCQSVYEWAQHVGSVGRARDHGIEPLDVARGTIGKSWSDADRALIRAVDEMYRDSIVSDATWRDLQSHFSASNLIDLLALSARYRRVSMVLNTLGVQPLEEEERLPVLKD